jgi:hypothetical protein
MRVINVGVLLLIAGLLLSSGCKSQKPVGLTKIPIMTPIVKTVTVPGPAQPLGGGNPLPGGNPNGGGTGTVTVFTMGVMMGILVNPTGFWLLQPLLKSNPAINNNTPTFITRISFVLL